MFTLFIILLCVLTALYIFTLYRLDRGILRLNDQPQTAHRSNVTVIVPMRNEQDNIPALFSALQAQYSTGFEIEFICVDDRSEDRTAELLDRKAQADPRFKIIHINDIDPEIAPKKRAISLAIDQARYEIILLTDADARPQRGWVASMLSYFDETTDMVIGYAPYTIPVQHRILYHFTALEYFSVAAVAAATTGLKFPITCVGTNMAYRKKVFREIDGFGPYKKILSGDDDLFLTHVREQHKYNIRYATLKETFVGNAPPKSINQYIHQRMRYASKGFKYPIEVTLVLAFYVIMNLMFILGLFTGCILPQFLVPTILVFIAKGSMEYLFLSHAASVLAERRSLAYYFPAAFIHPFYIFIFGILGPLNLFKWKEGPGTKGKP